jgi:hypothetical protein
VKHSGNCWNEAAVYGCRKCGKDELCDVCHLHDMPRGECDQCPAPTPQPDPGEHAPCLCAAPATPRQGKE